MFQDNNTRKKSTNTNEFFIIIVLDVNEKSERYVYNVIISLYSY